MNKIIKTLSEMENLLAGDGVPEDMIKDAEERLGTRFSKEYKEYLLTYGVAAVNGHELTGLGASTRVDVVDVTESVKKVQGINVPSGYVVENDNIDSVIYWQKTSGEVIRTVGNSEPKHVADSLLYFINL